MGDDCKGKKFVTLLSSPVVDVARLRDLVWAGCPNSEYSFRGMSWKLLLGYVPTRSEKREENYERKRREYDELSASLSASVSSEGSSGMRKQIEVDLPRTCSYGLEALKWPVVQDLVRRVLMVWSLRNLACGYVQGINDLATPILIVLLQEYANKDIRVIRLSDLDVNQLKRVECDLFWMLSKLLQDLSENYTPSQPGIQRQNMHLCEIIKRVDPELLMHMEEENIDTMQVSFRWFNCLLVREFAEVGILRIWDSLIAEGHGGLSNFLVYLASALLLKHSSQIRKMDFQEILSFFGNDFRLKHHMGLKEVESLLSEAYVLQSLFQSSPKHLRSS